MDRQKLDLTGEKTGAYIRPCMGESLSGDAVVAVESGGVILFAIIDALGHGSEAAGIARRVAAFLETFPGSDLAAMAREVDGLLRGGGSASGVAIGLSLIKPGGELSYLGIGNTAGRIVSPDQEQRHLVSKDGTAGQAMPTPVEQRALLQRGELLVLTTDGIKSRLESNPGQGLIFAGSAYHIAVGVVRGFGKDYDDAACLVYRHG